MVINFRADVTNRIPTEIGVTVFRILQEALHNAVKHSEVKLIEVQLSELSSEIVLTISDAEWASTWRRRGGVQAWALQAWRSEPDS